MDIYLLPLNPTYIFTMEKKVQANSSADAGIGTSDQN